MLLQKRFTQFVTPAQKHNICKTHAHIKRLAPVRSYDAIFMRTNMMADYLDKMSTDINYITYLDDEENDSCAYFQLLLIICLLIYMFFDKKH